MPVFMCFMSYLTSTATGAIQEVQLDRHLQKCMWLRGRLSLAMNMSMRKGCYMMHKEYYVR